jgi:hypothetical protein
MNSWDIKPRLERYYKKIIDDRPLSGIVKLKQHFKQRILTVKDKKKY